MDNVITDGNFIEYINEYMNTNYKLGDLKDFYYVQGFFGNGHLIKIFMKMLH